MCIRDRDVSLNQKEESNSVSSQRELLESFIGNHSELKDTKVQEYCDDGFTGTKFERPGYMKLMEDVRADKISCIVVKDLSRLGRDYIEVGSLLEQILPLYQVRVIAVNDNYDSDNYDGCLLYTSTILKGVLLVKLIEPPCTERYARWCERSEFLI